MKFPTEAGYDAAVNALQDLGLRTVDKNESAINFTTESSKIYHSYQHGLQPPQPASLVPSLNFTNRPYTSSSSEYTPFGPAPGIRSDRPYTAPQPLSFSQTLPPQRSLPPQMQLFASNMTTALKAPESLRLGAVEPKKSSAKPPAKKRAPAKTTKPKAVKNLAPSKMPEGQVEAVSLLSSSPIETPKNQAQAKGCEPLNLTTTSGNILQSPILDPAANDAEASLLPGPGTTGPGQLSTLDGLDIAAVAAESNTIDIVPSKSIKDTSVGSVLVKHPDRQAMAEMAGTSSGLNSNHPALASTAHPASASTDQPAIPKPIVSPSVEQISAEEFMSGLDKFIRDYQHLPAPEPRPTATDDLAAYAAQPDEVRQVIIKDMILDFLGDENFIKLAEDMSKEWRRIGLGL